MKKYMIKGLSLIEVAFVLMLSCIILVIGSEYFRSRHLESQNLTTVAHFSELAMALSSYISFHEDSIKSKFYSNGGKPWQLDETMLYRYFISGASDKETQKFLDGYGNKIHIIISLYKNQVYGLLVDDGVNENIPLDYLSKLKLSIGKTAGSFNEKENTINGIADSWSFALPCWSVSEVDIKKAPLLSLVFDKTFTEDEVTSLKIIKSEAGHISNILATQKLLTWEPVYTDDSINISYYKSNDIDYMVYSLSDLNGLIFKMNVYANSLLIKPRPSWVINGDKIYLTVKSHNKYNNTFSTVYNLKIIIEQQSAKNYFKHIFSRIDFNYSYTGLTMIDTNKYKVSQCYKGRDILATKIINVNLTPTKNILSGNLLIPIKFKLTYTNSFVKEVPLFLYSIFTTTDFYSDVTDSYVNSVDLTSGKCSKNFTVNRRSDINLYIINFSDSGSTLISSKNVDWDIKGYKKDNIFWDGSSV